MSMGFETYQPGLFAKDGKTQLENVDAGRKRI
jgi:hypothetical protein